MKKMSPFLKIVGIILAASLIMTRPPMVEAKTSNTFGGPTDFVRTLYPHAKSAAKRLGIDPKVLLAQAAHETQWGKHIPHQNGDWSYNLFGMRTFGKSSNQVINSSKEYINGKAMQLKLAFKSYDSYADSFDDYARLISENDRYESARAVVDSPYAYFKALQQAGYATDPKYADKLFAVYQSHWIKDLG